jgi:predicted Zn-ribbon and HTH transcriptional regulator
MYVDDPSSIKAFKAAFEEIRDKANEALLKIDGLEEERSFRWKCKDCGWIKHFTRPVPLEATNRCPRCKSVSFEDVPTLIVND